MITSAAVEKRPLPGLNGLWHAFAAVIFLAFATALTLAQADYSLMRDLAGSRYGATTADLVDDWQAEIAKMRDLPDKDKLALANNFFNSRFHWASDEETWDESDYWATPLEFMGRGAGDCEDYAIAKYTTLVLAGVDMQKLRITYVKARGAPGTNTRSRPHMVLAYYPSATEEPLILDNLVTEIHQASRRPDLVPVYGFNSQGIWVGTARAPATTQPGARLSRWRDLLQRAAAEGLE